METLAKAKNRRRKGTRVSKWRQNAPRRHPHHHPPHSYTAIRITCLATSCLPSACCGLSPLLPRSAPPCPSPLPLLYSSCPTCPSAAPIAPAAPSGALCACNCTCMRLEPPLFLCCYPLWLLGIGFDLSNIDNLLYDSFGHRKTEVAVLEENDAARVWRPTGIPHDRRCRRGILPGACVSSPTKDARKCTRTQTASPAA